MALALVYIITITIIIIINILTKRISHFNKSSSRLSSLSTKFTITTSIIRLLTVMVKKLSVPLRKLILIFFIFKDNDGISTSSSSYSSQASPDGIQTKKEDNKYSRIHSANDPIMIDASHLGHHGTLQPPPPPPPPPIIQHLRNSNSSINSGTNQNCFN